MPDFELPPASPPLEGRAPAPLARLTTFRLGGPPRLIVDCARAKDLVEAVARADADPGGRLLVLGGGSNVLAGPELGDLTVVRDRRGRAAAEIKDGRILVTAPAGASWDHLVAWTTGQGWAALAPLSGIPGSVGALPVQNVGAYGRAAQDVVTCVYAYDRAAGRTVRLGPDELGFGYRDSALKRSASEFGGLTPRWVVLDVTLDLGLAGGAATAPAAYCELADALGVPLGAPVEAGVLREAVLAVRRSKGMVLDP
ncbi:MAG: FAD-binding protein, partial [Bifidobacteriaceae bacterium]|nr:FAD-binding protein [Bifidobacteriaceae bacterium]